MKKETFNFRDAITAAVVAQRVNGGYVRESNYIYNDDTRQYDPTSIGNKSIMRYVLNLENKRQYADEIAIEKLNPVVTEQDTELAQEICDYVEGLAMKVLSDELVGYEANIYKVYENGVETYDFGLIASVPSSYQRTIKRENLEYNILKECSSSDYIAEPGTKIESDLEILNHIFSRNYNAHIYTAKTPENNLVTFWSQKGKDEIGNVGDVIKVKAKVKRVCESRFYDGVKETQLNYVKLV